MMQKHQEILAEVKFHFNCFHIHFIFYFTLLQEFNNLCLFIFLPVIQLNHYLDSVRKKMWRNRQDILTNPLTEYSMRSTHLRNSWLFFHCNSRSFAFKFTDCLITFVLAFITNRLSASFFLRRYQFYYCWLKNNRKWGVSRYPRCFK